ncbi:MAG: Fe-Mn family superoxide dismutase [Patescibacteria group bacterium]|jgi:Fe-Mn family superoxide dismutase
MLTQKDLPYAFDALEPHFDAQTMELHFTKHHKGYVDKANAALEGTDLSDKSAEEIITKLDQLPQEKQQAVTNTVGGHLNHTLFWDILTPTKVAPSEKLLQVFKNDIGEDSHDKFVAAASTVFGSGWTWLVVNKEGKLEITTTKNQDSPLMQGLTPILGLDVWEHAYYLKYQNKRPEYINAFFELVNWEKVEENYNATQSN